MKASHWRNEAPMVSLCSRTWLWGRLQGVLVPKHGQGNTNGDHDAADACVRRARPRGARAENVWLKAQA